MLLHYRQLSRALSRANTLLAKLLFHSRLPGRQTALVQALRRGEHRRRLARELGHQLLRRIVVQIRDPDVIPPAPSARRDLRGLLADEGAVALAQEDPDLAIPGGAYQIELPVAVEIAAVERRQPFAILLHHHPAPLPITAFARQEDVDSRAPLAELAGEIADRHVLPAVAVEVGQVDRSDISARPQAGEAGRRPLPPVAADPQDVPVVLNARSENYIQMTVVSEVPNCQILAEEARPVLQLVSAQPASVPLVEVDQGAVGRVRADPVLPPSGHGQPRPLAERDQVGPAVAVPVGGFQGTRGEAPRLAALPGDLELDAPAPLLEALGAVGHQYQQAAQVDRQRQVEAPVAVEVRHRDIAIVVAERRELETGPAPPAALA